MLTKGNTAPDFTASGVPGGEFTLSDYRRKSNVVLYFFLRAFARG